MALVLKNRVQETSTTTGTGTLTLAGAVTQFQTFSAAVGNGNTTYYTIYNAGGTEWEVGLGTVGAGTLARTTVLASSNAGAAVNFTGTLYVFGDYPADTALYASNNGTQVVGQVLKSNGLGTAPSWQSANNGTVTSVGISTTASSLAVTNSPITSSGNIGVNFSGITSQYVRGDGSLANFPTTGGGGSSVSYYLNGSVNQGTFGGNTYYEMNKTPVIGAGTNFTINADGYIAQFLTDAGDPALLSIPGGNWNFEMYFSASSSGGTPSFYVELYKYNGTTFTLISSGSTTPESITGGTAKDLYVTALAVAQTTLTVTDRLAVRVYVTHSGRTITLHTEDNNLCQVITTFSTGINALNGLTAQVQYFATGTSGTDFNISSATDTHTFNIPSASVINRGLLTSADWTTFNSKGSGTVTSVAATVPSFLSVSGSPITSSGTLAITLSGTALPAVNGGTGLTAPGTNGNVLTSNGTTWVSSAPSGGGGSLLRRVIFTSSGTWTKGSGTNYIKVSAVAGGGGGCTTGSGYIGSGGGAGAYAERFISTSGVTTVSATIGAAGTGASPGNDGGNTTFGSYITCTGGQGGQGFGQGGTGGTATNGNLNVAGGCGGSAQAVGAGFPGMGGASYFGGGNLPGGTTLGGYGSGGQGGNNTNFTGGDGVQGLIIVEEYA